MNQTSADGHYLLRRDYVLWALLAALLALSIYAPGKIPDYPYLVNWPTIQTLIGLLLLTKGIEKSGWLEHVALTLARRIHNQRNLAFFLSGLSVMLAMVLTNDIALFVVVPLTLVLSRLMALPLARLVAFEAIAVNAGSLLTPIGNPQNILLWRLSGVGFGVFMWHMLPLFVLCLLLLAVFVWLGFRPVPVHLATVTAAGDMDHRLLLLSASLYVPFLVLADLHWTAGALLGVMLIYLVAAPRILRQLDWSLIVVFVLMFMVLGLVAELPWVSRNLAALNLHQPATLLAVTALLAQGISNVPATILLTHDSGNWSVLAWGANLGGFGLVLGSLANLIALRLGRQPRGLRLLHGWSVPFFLLAGALAWTWQALAVG